jgi:Icc-related predicted phosphoesterase
MELIAHGKNVHELIYDQKVVHIAMLSDIHWDNPKCDLDLLKHHLDYCKTHDIKVVINGDFFCLMQGRGDNRRNKSDIRAEHNNAMYLDSIVNTAVEWFTPYAETLLLIGYGNHETGIIKYQETDILRRFVDLLNFQNKTNVQVGGYGGWLVVRQFMNTTATLTTRIKYYHGSGGGGIVTKGALNLTRALETYENFDVFTMGHIHENSARNDVRDTLSFNSKEGYRVIHKQIHSMLTGTYKEEYGEGTHGWHVERGAPPKPLGGRILQIEMKYNGNKILKSIDSFKFPL